MQLGIRFLCLFSALFLFSIGQLSAQSTITLNTAPQNQTVNQGATATFSISVQSPNTITYQWMHPYINTPLAGATSATLTLNNVQTSDAGDYIVIASDGTSSVIKDAVLTVIAPPTVSNQNPFSYTAFTNQSVTLDSEASGSNLTYQWFKDGVAISGATAGQYTFTASSTTAGVYTAEVSNSAGTVTSGAETIVVVDPIVITVQPQPQVVAKDGTITLSVTATGQGPLHYEWWGPNGGAPRRNAPDSPTLTIPHASTADVGPYSVIVYNSYETRNSVWAQVDVSLAPIIDDIGQFAAAVPGSAAILQADVQGYYVFTYQWKKDGVPISTTLPDYAGADTKTLTINSAANNDSSKYTVAVTNLYGTTVSQPFQLSYDPSDFVINFSQNPVAVNTQPGATVTFSVAVTYGKLPKPPFVWFKDGVTIDDSNSTTLTLVNVGASDLGSYYADAFYPSIRSSVSFSTSSAAALSFDQSVGPVFTTQPSDVAVNAGDSFTLTAIASGSPAPTYQWRKSGVNISGATDSTFTLTNAQSSSAGSYDVVATNSVSSVTSSIAHVTVSSASAPPPNSSATPMDKLVNISTRSAVGTGPSVQIAGFIIGGSSAKTVLIRANGPALQKSGITTGFLADPTLELHNTDATQSIISTNDNWGDNASEKAQILSAFTAVGATSWDDGSKDAAIVATLNPGGYTAIVAGKNKTSGIALVEVFEVDTANAGSKLINISTRSSVSTGAQVQIAGFIISGSTPRKVIIRANGPALSKYGVTGYLADPKVELHAATAGQPVIATNDNWDASIQPTFKAAGIDNWATGSKDAAIVTTLNPGGYTAIISGAGGSTGIALVEVFDISDE